jgi:parallel beta-helix repeat protein
LSRNSSCIRLALLLLLSITPFALQVHAAGAQQNIYIRANGDIEPDTAPILRQGEVYTFTGDIVNQSVLIERNGITVDGAWHKLMGRGALDPDATGGFRLNQVSNVTIKRVRISKSYWAISFNQSSHCTIRENEITNNSYGINIPGFCNDTVIERNKILASAGQGIYLYGALNFTIKGNLVAGNFPSGMRVASSNNCTVVENVFAGNQGFGIHLFSSLNIAVYHNNFVDNAENAVATDYAAVWDDGHPSGGNYWSGYNSTDADHDGIGDTPYAIDTYNVDRFPLMKPLRLCLLGDVNYDGVVSIIDITILTSAYGSREGNARWIPQADLALPYGLIDIWDVVTCAAHYKQIYP